MVQTDAFRAALTALVEDGNLLLEQERGRGPCQHNAFGDPDIPRYEGWYSRALRVVQQLLPDRYEEFRRFYRDDTGKPLTGDSYGISDHLHGMSFPNAYSGRAVGFSRYLTLLSTQVGIVASALGRLDYLLADILGVLHAQLFDDELSAAEHLRSNGHLSRVLK